jgi:crossover junction endodeoxyribonuclease RuvC
VLGIDPGSTITGYGVIERLAGSTVCIDCGTIRGGKGSLPDRLVAIDDGFRAVIEEFSPTAIAIENAFLGQNVKALAVMSQTRGVLLLAARRADLPEGGKAIGGRQRWCQQESGRVYGGLVVRVGRGRPATRRHR